MSSPARAVHGLFNPHNLSGTLNARDCARTDPPQCTLVRGKIGSDFSGDQMGAPGPQRSAVGDGRRCPGCGTVLAADNTARLCSRCFRDKRDQLLSPPQLSNEFFETDEFRAAFRSEHIGKVFRAYRNHPRHLQLFGKALNQELLGRWLGLTQGAVSKIESSPKRPEQNIDTLRHYAQTLHLPQHLLWFRLVPGQTQLKPPLAELDHDSLARIGELYKRPRGVDESALNSLALVLDESRRLEDSIGATPLLQPMRAQLTLMEGLVVDAHGPLRQNVVSLGSQYAQFAAWVHASAGDAPVARQFYDRATEWALEADDPNMVSTALSMKGHLAYRLRQLGPMLSLSQAAQRDKRLAPGIRALAAQQEARALALSGESDPCERKLDEAMALAIQSSEHPENEPPWVYFYSPGYFAMQRGRAYLYLGMYDKAAELLEAGLADMSKELREAEWAQTYQADLDTARKRLS